MFVCFYEFMNFYYNYRLLEFWRVVRSKLPDRRIVTSTNETLSPPIAIHCSAGIGR
jgi:hypothetical protein